ncbi:MAG: hypothetical protein LBQ88_15695 [Treponema sp.]|jgi:hypothetical protein|nr:hypothetical protein [Treponema sp.]
MMKVTLTRDIPLKTAVAYLSLERKVKRIDIQDYLSGKRFQNELVERRMPDYLQSIEIYDGNNHLTKYGESVRDTGMVKVKEEGKYQIWYIQNDSYFKTKIFYFKRIQPQPDGRRTTIKDLQINFDNDKHDKHYYLPTRENPFSWITLINNDNIHGEPIEGETIIRLTWTLDGLKSEYIFNGTAGENKIDNIAILIESDFQEIIQNILNPAWNVETQRFKILLDYIDDESLVSFERGHEGAWNGFDVHIDQLPIEPYSEEALLWRNRLLNKKLEKEYFHPKDFKDTVLSLNTEDGFTAYKDSLDTPDARQYLDRELEKNKKSDRDTAFWHLAAPLDLNPGIPEKGIFDTFGLQQGDELSFREIVERMERCPAESIFYYDRYVINKRQQQAAAAFLNTFACNRTYLITDTAKQPDNSIVQNSKIVQKSLTDIFEKNRPQHDRYLIIAIKGELRIWHISNSIDYIRFAENDISADTKGEIAQSVMFNKVKQDMLHTALRNFIQQEVKNG